MRVTAGPPGSVNRRQAPSLPTRLPPEPPSRGPQQRPRSPQTPPVPQRNAPKPEKPMVAASSGSGPVSISASAKRKGKGENNGGQRGATRLSPVQSSPVQSGPARPGPPLTTFSSRRLHAAAGPEPQQPLQEAAGRRRAQPPAPPRGVDGVFYASLSGADSAACGSAPPLCRPRSFSERTWNLSAAVIRTLNVMHKKRALSTKASFTSFTRLEALQLCRVELPCSQTQRILSWVGLAWITDPTLSSTQHRS